MELAVKIIKNQQEEIEHWKNGFERELEKNQKVTTDLLNQDLIISRKDKIIDLMALAIVNYDDQLVINRYKDKEHVKETFEEYFKNKVNSSEQN